jgi:hypothetical protein
MSPLKCDACRWWRCWLQTMTTGPKGTVPPSSSAWIPMPRTSFAPHSKSSTIQVRFFAYFTLLCGIVFLLCFFSYARSSCLSFSILVSNTCLACLLSFPSLSLISVFFHSLSILYVWFPSTHHLRYLVCLLFLQFLIHPRARL